MYTDHLIIERSGVMFSLLPFYCNASFCVCTLFTLNFVHKISIQSLFDHPFAIGLPAQPFNEHLLL